MGEAVVDRRALMEERLREYLKRDGDGMRLAMMRILLDEESISTKELYERLGKKGVRRSYRGVCAALGAMNSRLGILAISTRSGRKIYRVKPECRKLVRYVMENYGSEDG